MNFLTEKLGFEPELNRGLIASVVFHVALFLFAWFGVPHLFEDDIVIEQPGLKAAMISDITAAPKVDKVSDKQSEKPKQQKAEPPKKKIAPAPTKEAQNSASAPPPPEPEQQAAIVPDQTQPKDKQPEKKEPEKKAKKKPEKKKPEKKKKAEDEPFDPFKAFNLEPNQATDPTPEPPKKDAAPEPTEPTEGQQTAITSPIAVSASDADGIGQQIGKNWSVDVGALPDPSQYMAYLRVKFDGDGNVMNVEFLEANRMGDPKYRMVAESCRRAFMITKRVVMPSGKALPPVIRFGCDPQYANGG